MAKSRLTPMEKQAFLAKIPSDRVCGCGRGPLPLSIQFWTRRGLEVMCNKCSRARTKGSGQSPADVDKQMLVAFGEEHNDGLCPGCHKTIFIDVADPGTREDTHLVNFLGEVECKRCRPQTLAARLRQDDQWFFEEQAQASVKEKALGLLPLDAYKVYKTLQRNRGFDHPCNKWLSRVNSELELNKQYLPPDAVSVSVGDLAPTLETFMARSIAPDNRHDVMRDKAWRAFVERASALTSFEREVCIKARALVSQVPPKPQPNRYLRPLLAAGKVSIQHGQAVDKDGLTVPVRAVPEQEKLPPVDRSTKPPKPEERAVPVRDTNEENLPQTPRTITMNDVLDDMGHDPGIWAKTPREEELVVKNGPMDFSYKPGVLEGRLAELQAAEDARCAQTSLTEPQ